MPTVVPVSAEAAACFRSKILVSRNAASNQTMADTIATTTSMLKGGVAWSSHSTVSRSNENKR